MSKKNSAANNNLTTEEFDDGTKETGKPIFLYVVIGVLTVAVIALGAVSFLSLNHLLILQQKVQSLSDTVQAFHMDGAGHGFDIEFFLCNISLIHQIFCKNTNTISTDC